MKGLCAFVEIEPKPKPKNWTCRNSNYSTLDFKRGDRVRIYLAHSTTSEVEVRDGVVTNPHSSRENFPALQLLVESSGRLQRRGEAPFVISSSGCFTSGPAYVERIESSYRASFKYPVIARAERRSRN